MKTTIGVFVGLVLMALAGVAQAQIVNLSTEDLLLALALVSTMQALRLRPSRLTLSGWFVGLAFVLC